LSDQVDSSSNESESDTGLSFGLGVGATGENVFIENEDTVIEGDIKQLGVVAGVKL